MSMDYCKIWSILWASSTIQS